ncbi:AraC family transcriptional regulator [Arenimonas sp.]|uniref:helix-turn-helix transcriptional regulator n=1 Tax=Arenimonas sp. TaxID=1872635 RepID=UPI0039E54501
MRPRRFFGEYRAERRVGELALAELEPTVPEDEVRRHTHDDAHFLLLLEGQYLSEARGMPALCSTRTLVLNPPGTTHRDRFRGLQGRFFTLSVPAQAWQEAATVRALPESALRMPATALVRATLLRRELQEWDGASPLAVEAGFEELLDAAALARAESAVHAPAWLERACDRLRQDWSATPRLAELAREADLHPVYFARAFRRRYRCSPGQYLRRFRLERALDMLHERRASLADIALACGYVDQSHFTHAFRRAYRCTPAQYRALA